MHDKSSISGTRRLRSRTTTDGLDRAPHRAFLRAMGLNDEAIARPFIGVVSTAGEIAPCNLTLGAQASAAKAGVVKAGGTPREFTTISVSDGLSMNHQGWCVPRHRPCRRTAVWSCSRGTCVLTGH
jgi:dihydroxy-acid dehydratase